MNLVVLRDGSEFETTVSVDSSAIIGILASNPYTYKDYNLGEGIKYGFKDGVGVLTANLKGFGKIFKGQESASESLQGPIGIATIYGPVWKWPKFWYLTGLISLILGFMNLLPIPALDGGHAIFLSYEMITRRQLSDKFMEYAQIVGMVILISLMVFAVGNDFWKHIIN
jgi:regulator of sigma E protease